MANSKLPRNQPFTHSALSHPALPAWHKAGQGTHQHLHNTQLQRRTCHDLKGYPVCRHVEIISHGVIEFLNTQGQKLLSSTFLYIIPDYDKYHKEKITISKYTYD